MEVAFIEPIPHLGDYKTGMHMVLPEGLDNRDYFQYFQQSRTYKILDNGAAEGRDPSHLSTWEYLAETAALIRADEIVVPDAMGHSGDTQRRAVQFGMWLEQQDHFDPSTFKWMGVVHGNSFPELMSCMYLFAKLEYITVLGLPRLIANNIGKDVRINILSTPDLVEELLLPNFPDGIHCLGSSRWPKEVLLLADTPARSIDTSYPATMSLEGINIRKGQYRRRPEVFWPRRYRDKKLADRNHQTYLEWCDG